MDIKNKQTFYYYFRVDLCRHPFFIRPRAHGSEIDALIFRYTKHSHPFYCHPMLALILPPKSPTTPPHPVPPATEERAFRCLLFL